MTSTFNNISACFSLRSPRDLGQLQRIVDLLIQLNCNPAGEISVYSDSYIEQELCWSLLDSNWTARLRQTSNTHNECTIFSFDVDTHIFLPGDQTHFSPNNDQRFINYQNLLAQLINEINPLIGEIDYEADLLCTDINNNFPRTIASWGNYLPYAWFNQLNDRIQSQVFNVVDEVVEVNPSGLLTFIHPLQSNRGWGPKHQKLDDLIKTHFFT